MNASEWWWLGALVAAVLAGLVLLLAVDHRPSATTDVGHTRWAVDRLGSALLCAAVALLAAGFVAAP